MRKALQMMTVATTIMLLLPQCGKYSHLSERCNLEPDAGVCEAYIPKYYYDKQEKKCKEFIWGGCGGVVPFDSLQECEKQCQCK